MNKTSVHTILAISFFLIVGTLFFPENAFAEHKDSLPFTKCDGGTQTTLPGATGGTGGTTVGGVTNTIPFDVDCCTCSAWTVPPVATCAPAGGCALEELYQTRTCGPGPCAGPQPPDGYGTTRCADVAGYCKCPPSCVASGGVCGCDGVCNSGKVLDDCNMCGGTNVCTDSNDCTTDTCGGGVCNSSWNCTGVGTACECKCVDRPGVVDPTDDPVGAIPCSNEQSARHWGTDSWDYNAGCSGSGCTFLCAGGYAWNGSTACEAVDVGCGLGVPSPCCGDSSCNGTETCSTCVADCGACETCSDNIKNQDETGIDCGGSVCSACPTCSDGIKNQDETYVDCGGTVCSDCCGNTRVDGAEECDLGGSNNGVCPKTCSATCTTNSCSTCTNGDICRAAGVDATCDPAEICTGGACPADAYAADGTACGNNGQDDCPTPGEEEWHFVAKCLDGICKQYSSIWCFVSGTPVMTPLGAVAIEKLVPGSPIYSWDLKKQVLVSTTVEGLMPNQAEEVLEIVFSDRSTVQVTGAHPYYDPQKKAYKPIGEFKAGDDVLAFDVKRNEQTIIKIEKITTIKGFVTIYNLSVAGEDKNFFANGVLGHNKDLCAGCNPNEGDNCYDGHSTDCVTPGTIQCNGTCSGVIFKDNGTICDHGGEEWKCCSGNCSWDPDGEVCAGECNGNGSQDNGESGVDCGGGGCPDCAAGPGSCSCCPCPGGFGGSGDPPCGYSDCGLNPMPVDWNGCSSGYHPDNSGCTTCTVPDGPGGACAEVSAGSL